MSLAGLEAALPAGDRILLDTTALAAYLEAAEPAHPVARHVIDSFVAGGRNPAIVSTVTVMEILIRPLRAVPPRHTTLLDSSATRPTCPSSGSISRWPRTRRCSAPSTASARRTP